MKLHLEPTETFVLSKYSAARVWDGFSDGDIPVKAAILWVQPQTHDAEELAAFDKELVEFRPFEAGRMSARQPGSRANMLAGAISELTGVRQPEVLRVLSLLCKQDEVLSELLAVVARPGPAPSDSGFEFMPWSGKHNTQPMWMFSGDSFSDIEPTHYLPEPNNPTEV